MLIFGRRCSTPFKKILISPRMCSSIGAPFLLSVAHGKTLLVAPSTVQELISVMCVYGIGVEEQTTCIQKEIGLVGTVKSVCGKYT